MDAERERRAASWVLAGLLAAVARALPGGPRDVLHETSLFDPGRDEGWQVPVRSDTDYDVTFVCAGGGTIAVRVGPLAGGGWVEDTIGCFGLLTGFGVRSAGDQLNVTTRRDGAGPAAVGVRAIRL
jgi:hypothetical protein